MPKKSKRKYYYARWSLAGKPSIGNVSFWAGDDEIAKRRADKIAVEINLTRTPRTITEGNRTVEMLPDRGMTKPL